MNSKHTQIALANANNFYSFVDLHPTGSENPDDEHEKGQSMSGLNGYQQWLRVSLL